MTSFIISLILIFIALLAVALRKTYYALPTKELKRRARHGDAVAKALYRAVSYGASLGLLLWVVIIFCFAGSFVVLSQAVPSAVAFVVEMLVIGLGFAWMPTVRMSEWAVRVVAWLTPGVEWLLNYLHPLLERLASFIRKHQPITIHTGLYEHEDLLALLEQQKLQLDSRFSAEELILLSHAITFGEKMVSDCMVPRREVRMIASNESISPIVIRELHDSGHSRFPVYQGDEDTIVGTLYLRDLINLKNSGKVQDVMEHAVNYVHEEYPLEQVLHAFLTTKHHLFIVVNSFEEFVGIITIEDILEQIIGCKIVDEFDRYDDIRAVAANHARLEHKEHQERGEEAVEHREKHEKISEEPTEVIK